MTALVFLCGIVAVYVAVPNGFYQMGPLTVYQWAFLASTSCAAAWTLFSKDRIAIASAAVLLGSMLLSWQSWDTLDPELSTALLDLGIAAWFIILGRRPWEFLCGGIFLASVLTGALTEYGYITDSSQRPPLIIAWSHPDITAILGHLAAVVLGAASGDSGKRVRAALVYRSVDNSLGNRGLAYLRSDNKNSTRLF